jgi:hypothetical protein
VNPLRQVHLNYLVSLTTVFACWSGTTAAPPNIIIMLADDV